MELLIELNELARHAISTQVDGQIISNGRKFHCSSSSKDRKQKQKESYRQPLFLSAR